jgi:hypothetical protein
MWLLRFIAEEEAYVLVGVDEEIGGRLCANS